MEYQEDFTQNPVAREKMYDEAGREQKGDKIVAVVRDHLGDISQRSLLDMSCSAGMMTRLFSQHFGRTVGIDIDEEAVASARRVHSDQGIEFQVMNALDTSFEDESFDVVVCNQMYEHVPEPQRMMREIRRLLAPGGVCYFGALNRLNVIEPHYGRNPFLSYLPKPLAHRYLQLLGRGDYYYETLYTYSGLAALCSEFTRIDYTEKVVRDPEKFAATDMITPGSVGQRGALVLLKLAYWAFPGYIWLLERATAR